MLCRFNADGSLLLNPGTGAPLVQLTPRYRNYRQVARLVTQVAAECGLLPGNLLEGFDAARHPRNERGRWIELLTAIAPHDLAHVGGLPVRRLGPDEFRIDTDTGHVTGSANTVADHIVEDHGKRALHGRKRTAALKRAGDVAEADILTEPDRAGVDARGFARLPRGAKVVSLHPDTHGRVGTIERGDDGVNRVRLEGSAGHGSEHVEPLELRHSWRKMVKAEPAAVPGELFRAPKNRDDLQAMGYIDMLGSTDLQPYGYNIRHWLNPFTKDERIEYVKIVPGKVARKKQPNSIVVGTYEEQAAFHRSIGANVTPRGEPFEDLGKGVSQEWLYAKQTEPRKPGGVHIDPKTREVIGDLEDDTAGFFAVAPEQGRLFESAETDLFTGELIDKLGRKTHFVRGKRIKMVKQLVQNDEGQHKVEEAAKVIPVTLNGQKVTLISHDEKFGRVKVKLPDGAVAVAQVGELDYGHDAPPRADGKSKGHIAYVGQHEYYHGNDGETYKAHKAGKISAKTGNRNGNRSSDEALEKHYAAHAKKEADAKELAWRTQPQAQPFAGPTPWQGGEPIPGYVYNGIPVDQINVDPVRFQFKQHVSKTGVTDEFKGTVFKPSMLGVVMLWKDPVDHKTYIVNGHHRIEMCHDANHPVINGVYINDEATTWKEARARGAIQNIGEGRGTSVDAATFMRDMGMTPAELAGQGVSLKGPMAAEAVVLMRLNDRLFGMVARGQMEVKVAAAIAGPVADHYLQDVLVARIDKEEAKGKKIYGAPMLLAEMARKVAQAPRIKHKDTGAPPDLFGADEEEDSTFVEQCELQAYIRSELSKSYNTWHLYSSKKRAATASAVEGNTLNVEENKKLADVAAVARATFDRMVNLKGPIADGITAAAVEYAKAQTTEEKNAVKQRALIAAYEGIDAEHAGNAGAGLSPEPGGEGAGTGSDPAGPGSLGSEPDAGAGDGDGPDRAPAGVTATPAFKSWFAASKVVDKAGKPLKLFRGEWGAAKASAENPFQSTHERSSLPSFTDNVSIAEAYTNPIAAGLTADSGAGGERMGAYYLSLQNPLDVTHFAIRPVPNGADLIHADDVRRLVAKLGGDEDAWGTIMDDMQHSTGGAGFSVKGKKHTSLSEGDLELTHLKFDATAPTSDPMLDNVAMTQAGLAESPTLRDLAEKAGYDGFALTGGMTLGLAGGGSPNDPKTSYREYRPMRPEQIKTAIGGGAAPVPVDTPAESEPDHFLDVPDAHRRVVGAGLSLAGQKKVWADLEREEKQLRKEGKIQGARGFTQSQVDAAIEDHLAAKRDTAADAAALRKADKLTDDPEVQRLLGILHSQEGLLGSINDDKGKSAIWSSTGTPVKWAETNVRQRATAQKKLIRETKDRLIDAVNRTPAAPPADPVADAAADYAANGTRAAAFIAWFGDWEGDAANASKVTNGEGEPQETHGPGTAREVYHGTQGDFDAFDKSKMDWSCESGKGFYFAENRKIAERYSKHGGPEKGKILAVYLDIKNPFDLDAPITVDEAMRLGAIAKKRMPEFDLSREFENKVKDAKALTGNDVHQWITEGVGGSVVNNVFARAGYDGITHVAVNDMGGKHDDHTGADYGRAWIAFEPTQIKSVANRGTFDGTSAKLLESRDRDHSFTGVLTDTLGRERHYVNGKPIPWLAQEPIHVRLRSRAALIPLPSPAPAPTPAPSLFPAAPLRLNEVTFFASGSNHSGEIRALSLVTGANVGVVAGDVPADSPAAAELDRFAVSGGKVFMDSGAFSEVAFGPDGPHVVHPLTDAHWQKVFAAYTDAALMHGRNAYVVAPDMVGFQTESLMRLQTYADEIRGIAGLGATVLVPIQKGKRSMAEFYRQAHDIVNAGEADGGIEFRPSIPMKKDATSLSDLAEFCRQIKPAGIHLLGIAPDTQRGRDAIQTVRDNSPATEISCDACLIKRWVGKTNGPGGGPRRLTALNDVHVAKLALDPDAAGDHETHVRKALGLFLAAQNYWTDTGLAAAPEHAAHELPPDLERAYEPLDTALADWNARRDALASPRASGDTLESKHDLFTGTITDTLGRQRRYVNGKPVAIPHDKPIPVTFRPRTPAAVAPAVAPAVPKSYIIKREKYRENRGSDGSFHDIWNVYDAATGEKANSAFYTSEESAASLIHRLGGVRAEPVPVPGIDSDAFKSWFGDWQRDTWKDSLADEPSPVSAVVDGSGKPLRVYHGTRHPELEAFDKAKLGTRTQANSAMKAFFFSSNPAVAESYADDDEKGGTALMPSVADQIERLEAEVEFWGRIEDGGGDIEVYEYEDESDHSNDGWSFRIQLTDMWGATYWDDSTDVFPSKTEADGGAIDYAKAEETKVRAKLKKAEAEYETELQKLRMGGGIVPVYLNMRNPLVHDFAGGTFRDQSFSELLDEALEDGYDGLIMENVRDMNVAGGGPPSDVYCVFEGTQIKSVNNRGTWDPADDRIAMSGGGSSIFRGEGKNLGFSAVAGVQWWSEDRTIAERYGVVKEAHISPDAKTLRLISPDGSRNAAGYAELAAVAAKHDIDFDAEQEDSGEEIFAANNGELLDAIRAEGYQVVHTDNIEGPATMVLDQASLLQARDTSPAAAGDTSPADPGDVSLPAGGDGSDSIADQRAVMAAALRPYFANPDRQKHLADVNVDELVKEMGLNLNRHEMHYRIRKLLDYEVTQPGGPGTEAKMRKMPDEPEKRELTERIVNDVEAAVLAHLARQGIPAPDPSLTTEPPKQHEETDSEREERIAARKAKQEQDRADARAFALANYKKPPAPETVSRAYWTALRFRQEMVQVEKDYAKITALARLRDAVDFYPTHHETARRLTVRLGVPITYNDDGRYQYPPSKNEAGEPIPGPLVPHELTNDVRKDVTGTIAAFDAEYERPYVKRLLNRYKYSSSKRNENQNLEGAIYQVGRMKTNMAQSWAQGWFDFNEQGVHAVTERTEAIKKRFLDPTFVPSAALLKECAYETWVPQRFRDQETTRHYLQSHETYLKNEHPYAKAHLDRAMARAAPKLKPLMDLAAERAKTVMVENFTRLREAAAAEIAYHAARKARDDFSKPYERPDPDNPAITEIMIPYEKHAEFMALVDAHVAANKDFFQKSELAVKLNHETGAAFLAPLLPKETDTDITIPGNEKLTEISRRSVELANEFLRKAVAKSWGDLPTALEIIDPNHELAHRAYCSGTTITVPIGVGSTTLVHEFGHRIEHHDGSTLGTLSKAFAMQAVLEHDGEIMHHLGTGYMPSEIGARDGFMDEYTGKFYPYQSSEVLSMGLQRLYDDPIEFYDKAPKHFAYTLACIHGFLTR